MPCRRVNTASSGLKTMSETELAYEVREKAVQFSMVYIRYRMDSRRENKLIVTLLVLVVVLDEKTSYCYKRFQNLKVKIYRYDNGNH